MLTLTPVQPVSDELAAKLRAAIANCGMSQRELADRIGIPQPIISRFLAGADMKLSTASKLAAYFKLSLTDDEPQDKPAKKRR